MSAEPTEMSPRARTIVTAARQILEREGADGLTMRRLGEAVGIRAPSLYKHFPDKATVEIALIEDGFAQIAECFEATLAKGEDSLVELAIAYRSFAQAHPHLYRLMTAEPLPRERLRPGVEARAAAPLEQAVGDPDLARAVWAFAHGMVILELDERFPADANLDAAWAAGLAAFDAAGQTDAEPPRATTS
jgi:AcrR family transcriptional regulator